MNNNFNIQPILNFTKRYESAVIGKSKEIRLTIEEAGILNASIAKLLSLKLDEVYSYLGAQNLTPVQETNKIETLEVFMDAGSFKD